ncbi:MAG: Nif3-like dinuclear metal center hexameric protein [Spirochaetia bacterium]
MRIKDFDALVRGILPIERMEGVDKAVNGLQVTRRDPEISRMAFAVDASLESFKRAAAWGADLLFTHHGLFFGGPRPLTGVLYERVLFLSEHQLALYSVHLPLDMHPELGNNAELARLLGLRELAGFGRYHGVDIGIKGILPEELTLAEISGRLGVESPAAPRCLAFGRAKIKSVGIVSGGAATDVREAIHENLDLFITGEASHDIYHECAEAGINVLFAGHYLSEAPGVKAFQKIIAQKTGLETCFIDIPTGM